jgi:hypothetical protein
MDQVLSCEGLHVELFPSSNKYQDVRLLVFHGVEDVDFPVLGFSIACASILSID